MHHFYCFQPIYLYHNSLKVLLLHSQVVRYEKRSGIIVAIATPGVAPLAKNLFKVGYSTTFSPYFYMLLFKVFPVLDTFFHFSSHSYHTVLKCSTLASHSIEQKMQRLFQGFTWFLHSELHTSFTMYSTGADNVKIKRAN